MERKIRKSPEQPKELWQQKGWKLKHVKGNRIYDGLFRIDRADKQHTVAGSVIERALGDKKILTILIKFPPISLHSAEEIELLPIPPNGSLKKLYEVYALKHKQNPPDSVNEAITGTEQFLMKYLPESL
ncbi:hypothetical protein HYW46_04365 [Candidatus Daviesbacteria bacterium]|nr:hypothetical protein [Candidatus Daviesbacteria bacterium]